MNTMNCIAAAVLSAACAVNLIVMLAYYKEPKALIPAVLAMGSFIGAQMMLDKVKTKKTR